MARDDDSSEWSEDGIPAVEILNYDLNNVGLKKLYEPEKVSSGPGLSSQSQMFHDRSSSSRKAEETKALKQTTVPTSVDNNENSIKIRYKIGYLPPPDVDPTEKPPLYDDHIHFLKHASSKSKVVRKNSIRNILLSPESIDVEHRSQSDLLADTRMNSSFTNTALCVRAAPTGNGGFTSSQPNDDVSSVYSGDDDDDDDEIPAVEILNYDLINIGLKKLNGEEEKVQDDADKVRRPSHVSVSKKGPAQTAGSAVVQTRQHSIKSTAPNKSASSLLNTVPTRMSETKSNQDDSEDNSSNSDDEIPAVEILNYDLINIGLKDLQDDSKKNASNVIDNPKAVENQGKKEIQVVTKNTTTPTSNSNNQRELAANNDGSDSEDDESNVSREQVGKESAKSHHHHDQDGSSECSDDGETPAIEILNYDLINAGLKKFYGEDEKQPTKNQQPSTNNKDSTPPPTKQISNNSNIKTKAPVVPSRPSVATTNEHDDESTDSSSNNEIPAVEILNYDLINAGLKEFQHADPKPTIDNEASTVTESKNQSNHNTKNLSIPVATTKQQQQSDDDEFTESSSDEIPAVEILNYDLINAGLKEFEHVDTKPAIDTKASTATISKNHNNTNASGVPSHPVATKTNKQQQQSDDEESTESSSDEIPAVEILNYDLINAGLKEFVTPSSSDTPPRNPEKVNTKPPTDSPSDDGGSKLSESVTSKMDNTTKEEISESVGKNVNYASDDISDTSTVDEIPAVEILNYDLIDASTNKFHESKDLHMIFPLSDTNKEADDARLEASQNVPPNRRESNTTSHALNDELSQQTKDSSIPDSQFEDYGHFLSVAQKKEKSMRQGRTTTNDDTILSSSTSGNEGTVVPKGVAKPLPSQRLDTFHEPLNVVRDDSNTLPTTTTTTTTVETRTKTVVEPDGTTVTTTIITTRTVSKVLTNDARPPEPIVNSNERLDNIVETTVPGTTRDDDVDNNDAVGSEVIESKEVRAYDVQKKETVSNKCAPNVQKSSNAHTPELSKLELTHDTVRISNLVKANEESVPRPVAVDQGSENRTPDVGNNTQQSHSDLANEISNPIGVVSVEFEDDDYCDNVGDIESIDFDVDDDSCSQGSETGQIMKEMESVFAHSYGDKNQSISKYNTTDNFAKTKGVPLFEDHGDFLSEAASLRSGIDLKSIVEEEKRNDEIAKRKILSLGVSLTEPCSISPLPSPNSAPSKNSSALSGIPMTCDSKPVEGSDSEFSDSEWSNAIPAKEILNYDLINVGLKDLES